jgi:zinc-ribbon domain
VAGFCSNCGAQVVPGAYACSACGTPVAAAPGVGVPVQSAVPNAVPPPRQGTSTLKIVLIIVAIFVGLGILGAGAFGYMVWRAAHAIRMAANGEQLSLNTPGGSFSANASETFSSSDLGTDIYPGATPTKGSLRMTLPTGTMVSAGYLTSDSKDQVVAFYKNKFGSANTTSFDSADGSVITHAVNQQESVVVTVTSNPSQDNGKTQIRIVHSTQIKPS